MPDYFTLAELRALPDMSSTATYPDAACELAAAYIVSIIEREVGVSFIARTVTAEVHDGGREVLVLEQPYVRSVTSVTVNGVATTTTLRVRSGVLRQYASATAATPIPWAAGSDNILVTYAGGYSATPPGDIKEAALQGTRARLLDTRSNSRTNDRTTSISNDAGGTTSFVVAGEDHPTGYPEVDAVIDGWADRIDVHGFC